MKKFILLFLFLFFPDSLLAQFNLNIQSMGSLQSYFPSPEDELGRKTKLVNTLMAVRLGGEYTFNKNKVSAELGFSQNPLAYPAYVLFALFGYEDNEILKLQRSISFGYGRELKKRIGLNFDGTMIG